MPESFYAIGQIVSWLFMLTGAGFLIYVVVRVEQDRHRTRRTRDEV